MSELHDKLDSIQTELKNLKGMLQKLTTQVAAIDEAVNSVEGLADQLPKEQKEFYPFERYVDDNALICEDWLLTIGAENKEDKKQYDLTSKYSVCRVSTNLFSVFTRASTRDGYAYVSLINVSRRKDLVSLLLKLQVTHKDFLRTQV